MPFCHVSVAILSQPPRIIPSRFQSQTLYQGPIHSEGNELESLVTQTNDTGFYNVDGIRMDFPILHQEHHAGVPLIYLDNAATSQKPLAVIRALDDYFRCFNANVHRGIHKLSEEATAAYEEARLKIRTFINASSKREIIFTRGTTEGINLVAQTWARANLKPGDVVLSTQMEHHSNIVPWQLLAAEKGIVVRYVPVLPNGTLDMETYGVILRDEPVKLVAVTYVSNVLGTINPVAEMARQAHDSGSLILVDAAQAAPHMLLDVQAIDADFVAFSGHKMMGPTGSGVLYGKRALLEAMPPWMGGGDMISRVRLEGSTWNDLPYKFEAGTPAIAEMIGLGYAVDYLVALGMDNVRAHERALVEYALDRLADVPGVTVYGPPAWQRGGVVTFTMENIHAHDLAQTLDSKGIAVRAGHHCAMPLHDYLGIQASARASFYVYNTTAEVDALIEALFEAKREFVAILDHELNPRNAGILDPADADAEGDNPLCGDHLHLTLRLDENQRITAVGWQAEGCSISQASASMLGEEILGMTVDEVKEIDKQYVFEMLRVPLSANRVHCALLSLKVLTTALYGAHAWHEQDEQDG